MLGIVGVRIFGYLTVILSLINLLSINGDGLNIWNDNLVEENIYLVNCGCEAQLILIAVWWKTEL